MDNSPRATKRHISRLRFASGVLASAAALTGTADAQFGAPFPLSTQAPLTPTMAIAVVGPFTGDYAGLGTQMENGVHGAVDEANRLRSSFDRFFTVRTFDDQNTTSGGVLASQFAISDTSIGAAIGHLSGRITEATEQRYDQSNLPLIVPTSSYEGVTAHQHPNVFRLPTKDSVEGRLGIQYLINTFKAKTIAVLSQDGDYGTDVAAAALAELRSRKLPLAPQRFARKDADFADVARKTLAASPDAVYLAGMIADMGPAVAELRKAGYTGPFLASQGFFDPSTIAALGKNGHDFVASSSMPPLNFAPADSQLLQDYSGHYGRMTPISAFCYAAAQIVIAASRRTAAADRATLLHALLAPIPATTIIGSFQFQPDGDPLDPNLYFYRIKNDTWSYIQSAHPSTFLSR
ncbi:MAG TPA: branched-chain amino acid ABC transporter substrate-binding protein [Candidatus Baltobacteraceae bacterium]|jgi:branched-chain amino acid transport system substrate-binding protein|nr:branched-chain amino acid ABC transporter substrate-binding protein [Candidatus Baltobacteraceae bacterium]